MTLTYILVDFENVQPSAADIGLVRGDGVRLCIFRGPGQTKYSADVAEAWQPLGASVTFIRCAKAGRNAVDMHIAFYLGELVAAQDRAAAGKGARFVVVSRDTDFDPLLMHVRSHGYSATRVASLKAALEGNGAEPAEPKAARKRATRAAPAAREKTEKAEKATAAKAPAAKKSAGRKAPAKKSAAAPAAAKKTAAPARAPARPASDAIAKVIASLQKMGDKRPTKRARLERHIESHLGRKMEPGQLAALMEQLERDGVLVFDDNKVEYRLPKAKK
jgi:flagellar biosynthesis GTPase FlhF